MWTSRMKGKKITRNSSPVHLFRDHNIITDTALIVLTKSVNTMQTFHLCLSLIFSPFDGRLSGLPHIKLSACCQQKFLHMTSHLSKNKIINYALNYIVFCLIPEIRTFIVHRDCHWPAAIYFSDIIIWNWWAQNYKEVCFPIYTNSTLHVYKC